jgi:hypothetical protein
MLSRRSGEVKASNIQSSTSWRSTAKAGRLGVQADRGQTGRRRALPAMSASAERPAQGTCCPRAQQCADTKRTDQMRHARRLATRGAGEQQQAGIDRRGIVHGDLNWPAAPAFCRPEAQARGPVGECIALAPVARGTKRELRPSHRTAPPRRRPRGSKSPARAPVSSVASIRRCQKPRRANRRFCASRERLPSVT